MERNVFSDGSGMLLFPESWQPDITAFPSCPKINKNIQM